MKRILVLSLLTLTMLAGVASADRDRGRGRSRDRDRHHQHQRNSSSWNRGGVVVRHQPARVYRPRYERTRVVRRPIYVQRPVITVRHYNYYRRPALITESYAPMSGYYWVNGSWHWNGFEWIWTAGHYEPDPNYIYGY